MENGCVPSGKVPFQLSACFIHNPPSQTSPRLGKASVYLCLHAHVHAITCSFDHKMQTALFRKSDCFVQETGFGTQSM